MQSRYAELKESGAELVGVSCDTVEENLNLANSAKLGFSILSDPDLAFADALGLRHVGAAMDGGDIARPAIFIIDESGQIAWRQVTDNYRIRVRPEAIIDQL